MRIEKCGTHWARIYIAGPIDVAKQIIRRECMKEGLCVTITPTDYIYTGGEEAGYVVEIVQYPRFPKHENELTKRAVDLALTLREETYQHSALVVTPETSTWFSTRTQ